MERVEVVCTSRLVTIANKEVEEPGAAEAKQGCKSSLLAPLFHSHWVEDLILVYVSSILVMVVVGHLPWVIWNL